MSEIKLPHWLLVTLVGVFLFRIPSFLEPFYYGDELIYLALGRGIRQGLILYKEVHDNKPPLLYFIAALSGNIFWFRVILCVWMIATIILFWKLAKILFKNKKTVIASTVAFAILTSLPFFEGGVANAELLMIGPIVGSLILILRSSNFKSLFLAGCLISVATLFKIPSIFDAGAIIALWLFTIKFNSKDFIELFRKTGILFLGILIPIAVTFVWYALRGAFHEYVVAAFLQNFGYVSSWKGNTEQLSFLSKNGPLLMRGIAVLISFVILYLNRKRRSKVFLLSCMWLATSLFAATLSERPYPHYFVQVLPAIALLIGTLYTDERIEQVLAVFPLTIAFAIPVYFGFWNYSTSLYLGRFQTFLSSGFSQRYYDTFSPFVWRNYELAHYINERTSSQDRIFVWGDSSAIYALSKRLPPIKYVADYHIRDFSSEEETVTLLENNPPRMIVFLNEAPQSAQLTAFATNYYSQSTTVSGAKIWYNTAR